jgi:hypothetical protein
VLKSARFLLKESSLRFFQYIQSILSPFSRLFPKYPFPLNSEIWPGQTMRKLYRHYWWRNVLFVLAGLSLVILGLGIWAPFAWETYLYGPKISITNGQGEQLQQESTLSCQLSQPVTFQVTQAGRIGGVYACCLDYGDGNKDTLELKARPRLSHAYAKEGSYWPRLIFWDKKGGATPKVRVLGKLEVSCPGKLQGSFSWEARPQAEGWEVQFNSQASGAPASEITYLWEFEGQEISTDPHPTRQFSEAGTYRVSLSLARFLSTNYNCGDTAYFAQVINLGEARPVSLQQAEKPAAPYFQTQYFLSASGLSLSLLLLFLLTTSLLVFLYFFVQRRNNSTFHRTVFDFPASLHLPLPPVELFPKEQLSKLSQNLQRLADGRQLGNSYLFLIEKKQPEDHYFQLMRMLCKALAEEGLAVKSYYFQGDPSYCFGEDGEKQLSLASLAAAHGDHFLVICSSGEALLDPFEERVSEKLLRQIRAWKRRATVFTPIPVEDWEERESQLAKAFFLCPADQPFALAEAVQGKENVLAARPPSGSLNTWQEGLEYSSRGLGKYLGKRLFQWLTLTSLWPTLNWSWTLNQRLLFPSSEATYYDLVRLCRIPWLREGGIPPRLNKQWLALIPPKMMKQARKRLLHILQSAQPPLESLAYQQRQWAMSIQEFYLDPARDGAARRTHLLLTKQRVDSGTRSLLKKSLTGFSRWSLSQYLHQRFGRLPNLMRLGMLGVGISLFFGFSLHQNLQREPFSGQKPPLAESFLWRTENWLASPEVQLAEQVPQPLPSIEQVLPEVTKSEQAPKVAESQSVPVEPERIEETVEKREKACGAEKDKLVRLQNAMLKGEVLVDRESLPAFNRLKAYLRDNGISLVVERSFQPLQENLGYQEWKKEPLAEHLGQALSASLRYRKGTAEQACHGPCLQDPPRTVRMFLADLERDPAWRVATTAQGTLRFWIEPSRINRKQFEKAQKLREVWKTCW